MHHLCTSPEGLPYFYDIPVHVKPRSGSSRCIELNHTLRCLCGPPSIPLSFNLAAVLPRRSTHHVSCGAEGVDPPGTWWTSFRAGTTRVSNPVRSPSFRASASGVVQGAAYAVGVPPDLYAFHRSTRNSTPLSDPQVMPSGYHPPR